MAAGDVQNGVGATFKYGATPAVMFHTAEWEITPTVATNPHATNSTSGWTKRTTGTKDWTGTVKVYVHDGEASPLVLGTSYAVEFHRDATGNNYYSGNAVVASPGAVAVNIETGENVSHTYALEANGVLTANGDVPPVA